MVIFKPRLAPLEMIPKKRNFFIILEKTRILSYDCCTLKQRLDKAIDPSFAKSFKNDEHFT